MNVNTRLIRQGLILILFALVGALFIPAMAIPRLGLSAHTIGVMSGSLLMVVGTVWWKLVLSEWQRRITYFCWLVSAWANWAACLSGAIMGAGRMTPVAANGASGPHGAELLVSILLSGVVVTSIVALVLTIWGLKSDHLMPSAIASTLRADVKTKACRTPDT